MDSLENKNNHNMDSGGENSPFNPDPIVQARDSSNKSNDGTQPTKIMPVAKKPVSVVDATLLPDQYMRMGGFRQQAAPSPAELVDSILRFKWTIIIVFILVAVPAIAAIWTQVVPKYQARAVIYVHPIIPRLVFRTEDNGMIPLYDSFMNTQVTNILSSTVLQRVLDRKEIKDTKWYKKPPKTLVQQLLGNPSPSNEERLRSNLLVRPLPRTEIIDIRFSDPSRNDARVIVDAVVEEYLIYIKDKSNTEDDVIYRQLTEQYDGLKKQIQEKEEDIAKISKALGTGTPQELVASKKFRLAQTESNLSDLRRRINLLEWEIKRAAANDSNNVAEGVEEKQSKYYVDAEWRRFNENVRIIRHNIDISLYKPEHPEGKKAQKDLAFAEESLKRREEQLDELWRDRPITIAGVVDPNASKAVIEYQLEQAKYEEKLLSEDYNSQKEEFKPLFNTAQALEKENNDLQRKRALFDTVRQRLEQKTMERDVPDSIGSIEKGDPAFASSRPSGDRRIVFTAMSLFMGLGMGFGLAFLRATRNQTVYTSRDMPYPMQAPLLGYIPITRIKKSRGKSLYHEITRSRYHLIESVRIVRTALLSRLNGHGSTTLLITSANAGTGKSAFTMMLGKSLAQAGKNVLIIDSDFHKMSLTKQFDLSSKSGLMESLSSSSTDSQCVFPTETPGLSVMPAGNRGDDGAVFEQTANGAFKAFIGKLRKQYNIILLDSPPILPVADAAILSGQVDGTIIVERELVSRRASIIDALARLDSAGGRVLGTVFIGSSENEKYGYGYQYGKTMQS